MLDIHKYPFRVSRALNILGLF